MDNLIASVQSIISATEISNQQKSEIVNMLVEKTIEIEKLSIIQSILNEISKKASKNIEFNQVYPNIKTRAGKVLADRFNEMPAEMQEMIEKRIMGIKLDEAKLKDIMASQVGINLVYEPNSLGQIDCINKFPSISIEDSSVKSLNMVRNIPNLDARINDAINQYENGEPEDLIIYASELDNNVKVIRNNSLEGIPDLGNKGSTIINTSLALKLHSVNDVIAYDEPKTIKQFNLDSFYPKTFSAYISSFTNRRISGSNNQNIQQAENLPRLNQFVIFHVDPVLIKSPVPLPNPYIVGRVCSEDYNLNDSKPELRADVWFGGFTRIEVTIPIAAIYEWREFQ